jgi:hypothetical protein
MASYIFDVTCTTARTLLAPVASNQVNSCFYGRVVAPTFDFTPPKGAKHPADLTNDEIIQKWIKRYTTKPPNLFPPAATDNTWPQYVERTGQERVSLIAKVDEPDVSSETVQLMDQMRDVLAEVRCLREDNRTIKSKLQEHDRTMENKLQV